MPIVDRLYNEYQSIVVFLDNQKEPSLRIIADDAFRKAILLAAASYFECEITEQIILFFEEQTNNNSVVTEFIKNKTLKRQYHTFFDWDKTNANYFFSFFGNQFKEMMIAAIKANPSLETSIKAFMELGRERNRLVHENFGTFTLEKTTDELYDLYKSALIFIEDLPSKYRKDLSA